MNDSRLYAQVVYAMNISRLLMTRMVRGYELTTLDAIRVLNNVNDYRS